MRRLFLLAASALILPACGRSRTIVIQNIIVPPPPPCSMPGVVFLADKSGTGVQELFAADLFGTTLSNLSGPLVAGGNVVDYAWSPDRTWVAFVADKEVDETYELYMVLPAGGAPVKVNAPLPGPADVKTGIVWSPDSTRLAYILDHHTGNATELHTVGAGGVGGDLEVSEPHPGGWIVIDFAWAPDGSRLAYRAGDLAGAFIAELYTTLPADSAGSVKVSGPMIATGDVANYHWSPDGTHLAYRADQETDGLFEIYVSAATGSAQNVKVSAGDTNIQFGWSSDSSLIAFRANGELFVTLPSGASQIVKLNVPVSGNGVSGFFWSPDGSRIAYRAQPVGSTGGRLYTSLPDGTGGSIEVSGTMVASGGVGNLAWSPDGTRIALVSDREIDGRFALYTTSPTDGSACVRVSGFFGHVLPGSHHFDWSPDSARLVYASDQETPDVLELFTSFPTGTAGNVKVSGPQAGGGAITQFGWAGNGTRAIYSARQQSATCAELFTSPSDTAVGNVAVSGAFPPASAGVTTYIAR
jgi:Tol biopolymer transport system component